MVKNMIKPKLIALLKTTLGHNRVYGSVPAEGAVLPLVYLTEVANPILRDLSGDKESRPATWRLTFHVSDESTLPNIFASIETLDNTKTSDFQRIFTQYVLTETRAPGDLFTRAFYDIILSEA